jgi:hypothetical protein
VFFRAASLEDAMLILYGMAGGHGIAIPAALASRLGSLQPHLEALGIHTVLGGGTTFAMTWTWVAIAAAIAFFAPNTQQIMARFAPALAIGRVDKPTSALRFGLRLVWAVGLGLVTSLCLLSLSRPSEFLYFQF